MIQLCYCVCFCESAWFVQQFQFGGNFKNFGEYLAADFVVYLLKKKKKRNLGCSKYIFSCIPLFSKYCDENRIHPTQNVCSALPYPDPELMNSIGRGGVAVQELCVQQLEER